MNEAFVDYDDIPKGDGVDEVAMVKIAKTDERNDQRIEEGPIEEHEKTAVIVENLEVIVTCENFQVNLLSSAEQHGEILLLIWSNW